MTTITLDGRSLTIEQLAQIARDASTRVAHDPAADERVARGEAQIAEVVRNYREAHAAGRKGPSEYGVTTGFGEFKDKPIAPGELEDLQRNLLLSHSVGVGENSNPDDLTNYYDAAVIRGVLATRLNAFLPGHSGVRAVLVRVVEAMLNRGVVPLVPLRGSVGASGDLCPLSHLFATLLGAGRFYVLGEDTDNDAAGGRRTGLSIVHQAAELPGFLGLDAEEIKPTYKEGLALINGVNFSATMLALAVHDAERLVETADAAAALTLEAICGCTRALDPKVHAARSHPGQIASAARMRSLLEGSRLAERAGAVPMPVFNPALERIHGASREATRYGNHVAGRGLNATTDNPLFFPGESEPWDLQFRENWPDGYRGDERVAYSAGNFHGQPIALAADFLTIAVAELANISERRTAMLLDGNHNRRLPQNLTTRAGVNSGLMIAQYTAASLVSENKVLAHPASVDSIPTGANAEDHVSMSTTAARKLRTVLHNAQCVLAIELLTVAQALEWRIGMKMQPLAEKHSMSLEEADAEAVAFTDAVRHRHLIAEQIAPSLRPYYLHVRELSPSVTADRPLSEDVRKVAAALF